MSNIATSIVQSKHLLELGLSKETANMSYSEEYFGKDKDGNDEWCWRLNACKFVDVEGIIPAWSLSALLEVMSKVTCISYLTIDSSYLVRCKDLGFLWQKDIAAKDPVIASYEMVCWLLEQGFIKKGSKQ